MNEGVVTRGGRAIGFADYGSDRQTAVLWCHGGPGSRLEPKGIAARAGAAGYRLIGIDRPGYGKSTPQPGREIGGWIGDGLAVADHLRLEKFLVVGVSTGGAYALALAAAVPERVLGVVAVCALTDMRSSEMRAAIIATGLGIADVWNAPDREAALAAATAQFGADGSKMVRRMDPGSAAVQAMFGDPALLASFVEAAPATFAQGVQGYVDDRFADGPGWGSFDVARVRCPVIVVHGGNDGVVPIAHAHHTAALVRGAELRIHPTQGHFSILSQIVGALDELPRR